MIHYDKKVYIEYKEVMGKCCMTLNLAIKNVSKSLGNIDKEINNPVIVSNVEYVVDGSEEKKSLVKQVWGFLRRDLGVRRRSVRFEIVEAVNCVARYARVLRPLAMRFESNLCFSGRDRDIVDACWSVEIQEKYGVERYYRAMSCLRNFYKIKKRQSNLGRMHRLDFIYPKYSLTNLKKILNKDICVYKDRVAVVLSKINLWVVSKKVRWAMWFIFNYRSVGINEEYLKARQVFRKWELNPIDKFAEGEALKRVKRELIVKYGQDWCFETIKEGK